MKQCPRCASEITEADSICPRCGMAIKEHSKQSLRRARKLEKKAEKKRLKEEKKQKKLAQYNLDTDFTKFKAKEYMTKKQAQDALSFDIDENGEYNIDTNDVEIVDKQTQELLKKREKQTYSVKKARGEYEPEKIKWWELYKLANRSFARRKIKKEVNKAAKIKPDFVNKTKLLMLAIFLGWFGSHNFYVQNKKKGWFMLICSTLWLGISAFSMGGVKFFQSIELAIGGLAGFLLITMWLSDIINIIFNNFKYKLQRDEFISNLNVETRAKLGAKYIDMDLYKKPWWVRFKVWLDKKRRDYAKFRHERRQRLIEKEKERQAKLEEQAKIDAEILEYERKENEKLGIDKIAETIDKNDIEEIKMLSGTNSSEKSNEQKPYSKKKQPKVVVKKKK